MTQALHAREESTKVSMETYSVDRVLCAQPSGATLFVGEDRRTGDQVVVKQLSTSVETHEGWRTFAVASSAKGADKEPHSTVSRSRDSFVQEQLVARVLITHNHTNIVRCLSPPHDSTTPTLVMEYCPRGDLLSLIDNHCDQCLDESTALELFRGVVDGVAHLHSLDIAHRDLSLENVLLDAEGYPKICDFGLSTRASVPARECVGKLQYMAPEMASCSKSYDPIVADIWSLGIMLFIMLTGSPLFDLAEPSDRAWRVVQSVGISGILRSWGMRDGVSDETVALLSDMLRTDPAQRCQSADHVRGRLQSMK